MEQCLACGARSLEPLVDLGLSPTSTGALHGDREGARQTPHGHLDLVTCTTCGHVANRSFDPGLLDYDESYDNSLHFSPAFERFADRLAATLVDELDLSGAHVVEIGSGRGDFLVKLVALTGGTAQGFDPTYDGGDPAPGVELVSDYFEPGTHHVRDFDLLVCRHVLEHLDDPEAMLSSLRGAAAPSSRFYLEVPAAEFNFSPEGMWDCIYPHVSYFSRDSLRALLDRCGLEVEREGRAFEEQFLWVVARPTAPRRPAPAPESVTEHAQRLQRFASRWDAIVDRWRRDIGQAGMGDDVLWGAGAKAVTFLNAVDPEASLGVVDLNPRKWGRYLPGSGHRIDAPESLRGSSVSRVLVINPAYREEIASQVRDLGLDADVVPV